MSNPTVRLLPLLLFTALYMSAAVVGALVLGNKEFVFYIAVMLVLIAVIWRVHHNVQLSGGLLWALAIWGLAHMAGGLLPIPDGWPHVPPNRVLYSLWLIPDLLKYDQIVHAYGFGITTWLCWQAWSSIAVRSGSVLQPTSGVLLLCAAAGMGFGALNEVTKFVAVLTVPNTNVGGYENTGWDLVANMVGCVIAAVWIRWSSPTTPRSTA